MINENNSRAQTNDERRGDLAIECGRQRKVNFVQRPGAAYGFEIAENILRSDTPASYIDAIGDIKRETNRANTEAHNLALAAIESGLMTDAARAHFHAERAAALSEVLYWATVSILA